MNTKTTLPISEARTKIFKIVNEIQKTGVYYTITEKGRPKAVIMSAEEFESWQETLEVQKMFPNLEKDIKQAQEDYKKGNYVTLEEILKQEGYVLADKGKRKYEVSNRPANKNKKKVR
ncbi:type II toxin-antitoxin system Phd/YefM family antitoxin [Patescibacteria group bacterium]|nr:type II toxin-antitoxin system Phd/YefM family antitoxin [Patescibacteria group bacterium]